MNLSEVLHFFGFPSLPCHDVKLAGVNIDSRKTIPGELFVAISGEYYDGHDFVEMAFKQGALAAVVSKSFFNQHHTNPLFKESLIPVVDTQIALRDLAAWYRSSLSLLTAALTGSCGKTTTKEMIASILAQQYRVFATPGNKNNHLGVPLSLLQCNEQSEAAIFELGANHLGEIRENVYLVKPDVALITNIGVAHIGEFGGVEAIFAAKSEIFETLTEDGLAIYNADDAFAENWKQLLQLRDVPCKTFTFGLNPKADVRAENIHYDKSMNAVFQLITSKGTIPVQLAVPGEHNVRNALAASAVGLAFGVSLEKIAEGLRQCGSVSGRLVFKQGVNGARVIDDSYNANLKSVEAAIQVLAGFSGKRFLVLGDITELGEWGIEHHRLIGVKANELGLDGLFTCGTLSQHASESFQGFSQHFPDTQTLSEKLKDYLDYQTTLVVKGSRSSHMEEVVLAITI